MHANGHENNMESLINSLPWNEQTMTEFKNIKNKKQMDKLNSAVHNIRPQNLSNNSISAINSRHLNGI